MWPEHREGMYQAATISLPHNFRTSHDFDHGNQGGRDEPLLPKPLDKNRKELAIYYAMVSDVDHQVGRILWRALRKRTDFPIRFLSSPVIRVWH